VFGLLGGGGYAEYCVIPSSLAMKMPEKMSFEDAASIPEAFLTAYQALFWLGELKNDKTVLIHAAASGVGVAAIQLVKQFSGTKIIATAGSEEKLKFCKSLGADVVLNYKQGSFAANVLQATNNKGVDIILDFVGASYWKDNMECCGLDGTIVLLSMLGGAVVENCNLGPILRKRIQVKGSTLRNRSLDYKSRLTEDMSNFCLPRFADGRLKIIISKIFDIQNVQAAHSFIEENNNIGKVVLNNI